MQWYSGALLWREVLSVAQARVAPLSAIQQRRGKVEWGEPAIQGEKQGMRTLFLKKVPLFVVGL